MMFSSPLVKAAPSAVCGELSAEQEGLSVSLLSFLDEKSPVVHQRCQFTNHSAKDPCRIILVIKLQFRQPCTLKEAIHSWFYHLLQRFPGLGRLWENGYAKDLLFLSPRQVRKRPGGRIQATGPFQLTWGASLPPHPITISVLSASINYGINVPAGGRVVLGWTLGFGEENANTRFLVGQEAARSLQTRFNLRQPYGDWGVICVYPNYLNQSDLFSKSELPYCYHNGADWPYWDGVYAALLNRQGDPDWRYVLTRWWEVGLQQGRLTPVEYYSPTYPSGGMLQDWSAVPAAVLVKVLEEAQSFENVK